nr:intraflagellar transport protein 43 homolog isoform X4 [Dermacentor andersoni]
MDADELDDLESPVKKTFGSRARRLNIFGNNTTDIPTNAFASNGSGEGSKAPPKPRRNSGWAEDNSSSGLFRFRRSSARPPSTVPIEASKLTRNETVLERDDSDSEIPSIPDLGEVEYDDLATQVAQAPSQTQCGHGTPFSLKWLLRSTSQATTAKNLMTSKTYQCDRLYSYAQFHT